MKNDNDDLGAWSIAPDSIGPATETEKVVSWNDEQAMIRRRRRKSRATRKPTFPVEVIRMDPNALKLAHEAADGDLRRIKLGRDGRIDIANSSEGRRGPWSPK